MKYFGQLTTTTKDYELTIEENSTILGPWLVVSSTDVDNNTIKTCKKLAAEICGASTEAWHTEGKYYKSLIAKSDNGYTLRIANVISETDTYLYVFDTDSVNIQEYLQDTVQACKEIALKEFDVPLDAWQEETDF